MCPRVLFGAFGEAAPAIFELGGDEGELLSLGEFGVVVAAIVACSAVERRRPVLEAGPLESKMWSVSSGGSSSRKPDHRAPRVHP